MNKSPPHLWSPVLDQPQIDAEKLLADLEAQVQKGERDRQTRLLVWESLDALASHWTPEGLRCRMESGRCRSQLNALAMTAEEETGFPFLKEQVVDVTRADDIRRMLRELGSVLPRPTHIFLGGPGALILQGLLARQTQALDVVDAVPKQVRELPAKLGELQKSYRLRIGYFQAHYLPVGWRDRVRTLEPFGNLSVFFIEAHDIFLSKLFGIRGKDRDDPRVLARTPSKETVVQKLHDHCEPILAAPDLLERAKNNWYILYGEPLPT